MEIKIEDLRQGDEVLIGNSAGLKYAKILRPLKLNTSKKWKSHPTPRYSTVKCSFKEETITCYYVTYSGTSRSYTKRVYGLTSDGHNKEAYIDFNDKRIWLVKRTNPVL